MSNENETSIMNRKNWLKEVYRTRICHWCRRHLADGENFYHPYTDTIHLCENCKDFLINPPDFNLNGTKEKGTTSWRTANILTLIRDDCHCRVCGEHSYRENPIEVHHIIPQKDGGTHNLKNLITLCEKHHKETFKNGYAGLKIINVLVQQGIQRRLEIKGR